LVIKTATSPVKCNDIALPRWKLGGKWYCSFPALRDCTEPSQLPVDLVKIIDGDNLGLGLGKSIFSKEQMEEFARVSSQPKHTQSVSGGSSRVGIHRM
jgi:hypothetical protein